MRAVLQRVAAADVTVGNEVVARIGAGLLVYLGVARGDTCGDAGFVAGKIADCRIFPDDAGKMNLSVRDVGGAVLVVSNFTLQGDCRRGRRPSFDAAEAPAQAKRLCDELAAVLDGRGVNVQTGVFGEHMLVRSTNDGPVTLVLESAG
jgi:D-tyrosyl-tRNA(Tyr) deacylase